MPINNSYGETPKKGRTPKQSKQFKAVLRVNDKDIISEGDTILQALEGLHPPFYKTKGILTVETKDKKAEKLMTIWPMRRLFGDSAGSYVKSVGREILAKEMGLRLK